MNSFEASEQEVQSEATEPTNAGFLETLLGRVFGPITQMLKTVAEPIIISKFITDHYSWAIPKIERRLRVISYIK